MACLQLQTSWKCTLCEAIYCNLPTLVSHVRASYSHVAGPSFQCGIKKCEQTFHNTKHVRKSHADEYSAINESRNMPQVLMPVAKAPIHTVDEEDRMELTFTSMEPIAAHIACHEDREKPTSAASSNKVDVEDVAYGRLLKLRCRPGVTESLINEVRESIKTVVKWVFLNLEDMTALFENSERNYSTAHTAAVISLIDDASDPLASSLNTTYRLKSVTQAKYSTVIGNLRMYTHSHAYFFMYIQKCKPSIFPANILLHKMK